MYLQRCSALWSALAGCWLLWGLGGCQREQPVSTSPQLPSAAMPAPSAPALNASAKTTPASAAKAPAQPAAPPPGQPASISTPGSFILVEPQQPSELPTHFDKSGRFMAQLIKNTCKLWNLQEKAYLGTVEAQRCETSDWRPVRHVALPAEAKESSAQAADKPKAEQPTSTERTLASPDDKRVARWKGPALSIDLPGHAAQAGAQVQVSAGCAQEPCRAVIAAAFSPDGKTLAFARRQGSEIFLIDAASGKLQKSVKLAAGEIPLPDLLAWGPKGLVAVLGKSDASEEGPSFLEVYLASLKEPDFALHRLKFHNSYGEMISATLALDPFGRYLFEEYMEERQGSTLSGFDIVKNGELGIKGSSPAEEKSCEESNLSEPQWIPGAWPVLESVEGKELDCDPKYTAWRIVTAPGQRGLVTAKLKSKPPAGMIRAVKEDGKTLDTLKGAAAQQAGPMPKGDIDPSKRWQALGKDSVRRLSDQKELLFEGKDCLRIKGGVFDCPLSHFANWVVLLDTDPLKAPLLRGVQVAHRYYHPGLLNDFFDGKPVDPKLAGQETGGPPRLDKPTTKYLDGQTPNLEVTLVAHDGGGGMGPLQVWFDGRPFSLPSPLSLEAEKPLPVSLSLPQNGCGHLLLLACNRDGGMCSMPANVPFCPSKKHHVK